MSKASTVTKEKIAEELKEKLGLSLSLCEEITLYVFAEILNLVKKDQKLALRNFGTWKINHKKSRPGFNIHSGNPVSIAPRTVLRLNPSQSFKDKVNNDS
jgi:integration host factor subunit alpha